MYLASAPRFLLFSGIVAANGALLCLFGIIQGLTYNGRVYWVATLTHGGQPFASFVNRNHAGNYMGLCLATAIGVLAFCWLCLSRRIPRRRELELSANSHQSPALARSMDQFVTHRTRIIKVVVAVNVILIVGLVCSLSRGAVVSTLAAATIGAFALSITAPANGIQRATRLRRTLCISILVLLIITVIVGVSAGLFERFAEMARVDAFAEEPRIVHWSDVIHAIPDFWRVGAGLGTYRYVHRPYLTYDNDRWNIHAENEYLEMLLEGGIIGLGLAAAFVLCCLASVWRLISLPAANSRPSQQSPTRPGETIRGIWIVGFITLFALALQLVHGVCDFGIRIPANAILLAAICGGATSCGQSVIRPKPNRFDPALAIGYWVGSVSCPVIALLGITWAAIESHQLADGKEAIQRANDLLAQAPPQPSVATIEESIDELGAIVDRRPGDSLAKAHLAELHIQLYRLKASRRLALAAGPSERLTRAWELTSTRRLHHRAHRLHIGSNREELMKLRENEIVQGHLAKARDLLLAAEQQCALLPRVQLRLAELAFLSNDWDRDHTGCEAAHVHRLRRVSSGSADWMFQSGLLNFQASRFGMAFADWRASLSLSPRHLDEIYGLSIAVLNARELVREVIPPSPQLLVRLAEKHFYSEQMAGARLLAANRAARCLNRPEKPDADYFILNGSIFRLIGRLDDAISNYRRALMLNSGNIALRFELAEMLSTQGYIDDARKHARICVDMAPRNRRYREFLRRLSRG